MSELSESQKLMLRESAAHKRMDDEFKEATKAVDALYAERDELRERVKELEQERGTLHQFRAEAVVMRRMLLDKDVNAKDVAPCDLKESLLKRDLEQQAKGIEWVREEFCTVMNDDATKTVNEKIEQLRKKAEEL